MNVRRKELLDLLARAAVAVVYLVVLVIPLTYVFGHTTFSLDRYMYMCEVGLIGKGLKELSDYIEQLIQNIDRPKQLPELRSSR